MVDEDARYVQADDGARVDRAVRDGFADAIRLHREANLPMAIWENEQVRLVSPFDIPLPDPERQLAWSRGQCVAVVTWLP
jgi:hypothetical protein